jgi:hypothetical protein
VIVLFSTHGVIWLGAIVTTFGFQADTRIPPWADPLLPAKASSHLKGFSMDKGISDLAMCLVDIPPDGLAGNAKHGCCLLLLQILEVDQFQHRYLLG